MLLEQAPRLFGVGEQHRGVGLHVLPDPLLRRRVDRGSAHGEQRLHGRLEVIGRTVRQAAVAGTTPFGDQQLTQPTRMGETRAFVRLDLAVHLGEHLHLALRHFGGHRLIRTEIVGAAQSLAHCARADRSDRRRGEAIAACRGDERTAQPERQRDLHRHHHRDREHEFRIHRVTPS
jgi:hypothetical protein